MLDGLSMVITGAGSGMGAATAELAASYGARVMVSDVDAELAARVAGRIQDTGGQADSARCDVSDPSDIEALMEATAAVFGGIDVLHNNAGIADAGVTSELGVAELSMDAWEKVINVNLRGPWLCTKYALPWLERSAAASIVNVGSIGSFAAYPRCIAYGASKGGVALLTKNLALELAPRGIRVNAYAPAVVETDMSKRWFEASENGRRERDEIIATHLVPRLGKPEDIAELACFLASPRSSFVNGVLWLIDGGHLAWRGQRRLDT